MDPNTMNEVDKNCLSPVQSFYEGLNIFVTGGTGFLGKILLEKLLRSTDVATIYMLVREKKGKGVHSRVDEMLDDPIFDILRKKKPKYKHRVVGIAGDCSVAGLGISIHDRQVLIKNVNIVFHVAATVKFDEKLNLAYGINVNGARSVVALCRELQNLKSFMHVSTAYANCHMKDIEEKIYDCPIKYDDIGALLEKLSDDEIEQTTPKILGPWPNTYTFTKALAEDVIKNQTRGLPVGVFRPGIVISTYKEPIPSWIDNIYGPTGITAAAASGLLRTTLCDENVLANIVPVDTCVAGLIAAAWQVAGQKTERVEKNILVYNFVSTVESPITWREYIGLNLLFGKLYPSSNLIWTIDMTSTTSQYANIIRRLVFHQLPGLLIDTFTMICGQRPQLLKIYKKLHKLSAVIEYFATREWSFENNNVQILYEKLNEKDKVLFPMSMKNVKWLEYFKTFVLGIRQHILKQKDDTLEESRVRLRRFEVLDKVLKYVITFLTLNVAWSSLISIVNAITYGS